jgi:hypothetical protein
VPQPKRHAAHRVRALIALAIAVVILVGGGGASAIAYATVKAQAGQLQAQLTVHLEAGQAQLEAAKASLKQANTTHNEALVIQAKAHFTGAKVQFALAGQTADSSDLLQKLEGLPRVGSLARARQTAVDGIVGMGVAISDAGLELSSLDGQLLKPATGGQSGRTLLTLLDQTHGSLVKVRADFDRAQKAAAQVDVQVLPASQQSTFGSARATIASALAAIDEFERLVPVLTEVLGGNGVRTYLVEQVNPAELRPGGGFIGTFSVLRAEHGALTLVKSGNAYDLSDPRPLLGQRGYVAPPGPLLESVLQNTSWSFPDSNFFPDFPSNALAAENFVQPRLGIHIDGVISIDYNTVATLLGLTGPMAIPGYGITVNATNFIPLLLEYDLGAKDAAHKALLSAIAGPLMQRVSTLPSDRWRDLIVAFNDLATARHLQVYFNNDAVEKQIGTYGWSGSLNPTSVQDYMVEVESNLGATKANYFIVRQFTLELTRNGATLHHKVTIDITNNMPYTYRPQEYYSAYVRLYVSARASSPSDNLRRVKYPDPAPPAGTRLIDGWVPTFHGYGHSAQAVFEYDTPWQANGRGDDKIYWQKEPGTLSDKIDIIWHDGSGHTYTASSDLGQDRVIAVSTRGVAVASGQAGQASLPSLSLG